LKPLIHSRDFAQAEAIAPGRIKLMWMTGISLMFVLASAFAGCRA